MENTDKKTLTARIVVFAFIIIAIVVLMRFVIEATKTSTKYADFAQCLTQKGVKFYGAFWCPHCQAQEADFGLSREQLADIGLYHECSTPDAKGQTQVCIDNKIDGYPTWVFPDGSRLTGEQQLSTLATKSGCMLPAGTATTSGTVTTGAATTVTQ